MEYWLIYDVGTGDVLVRGSGMHGAAALPLPDEGAAMIVVPKAVVAQPELNLEALRAALVKRIDAEAEAVRLRYLTAGAGQALVYASKETEARAWLVDDALPTPFLTAEAAARNMTIAALAAEVVAMANQWTAIGAAIEGLRMGAKAQLQAAQNVATMVAAATIDWASAGLPEHTA